MLKKFGNELKKIVCFVLTVMILASAPYVEVNAEELCSTEEEVEIMEVCVGELPDGFFAELQNARSVLSGCRIIVDFGSDGMGITIFTGTTDISPIVGVKDIKVEQKVWYGWKEVAFADGAEVADTSGMSVHMTFTGAVKDETYRVRCTHYADLTYDGVENFTEGEGNTGSFVFTY